MTIIKRADLGRPLTWDELDDNFRQVDNLTAAASAAVSSASASATAAAGSATNSLNSANSASSFAADASASATAAINALMNSAFEPNSFDFTTGGTLDTTDRNKAVYNPADNNWYSWAGTLPHDVSPGADPTADSNWKPRTDQLLRQELSSEVVGSSGGTLVHLEPGVAPAVWGERSIKNLVLDGLAGLRKNFGALGDGGATDGGEKDTKAIEDAHEAMKDVLYRRRGAETDESTISFMLQKGPGILYENGVYKYNGTGLNITTGDTFIFNVRGESALGTKVLLPDGVYLFDFDSNPVYSHLSNMTIHGGLGAVRYKAKGRTTADFHVFSNLRLSRFTECGISNNSIDMPYFRVERSRFYGATASQPIGVCVSGLSAGGYIRDCLFSDFRYAIKLAVGDNGTERNGPATPFNIEDNDFYRTGARGAINEDTGEFERFASYDIWIEPGATTNNAGRAIRFAGNKFGQENLITPDAHVLIADSTTGSGLNLNGDRAHVEAQSTGFISGLRFEGNNVNSSNAGYIAPFLISYTPNLGNCYFSDIYDNDMPSRIIEFAGGIAQSQVTNLTRSNVFNAGQCLALQEGGEPKLLSNLDGIFGIEDPLHYYSGHPQSTYYPVGTAKIDFVSLFSAQTSTITASDGTKTAVPCSYGALTEAVELAMTASTGRLLQTVSGLITGRKTWLDVEIKRGSSNSVQSVKVEILDSTGMVIWLRRIILLDSLSRWQKVTLPFVPSTAGNCIVRFSAAATYSAGSSTNFIVGNLNVYHNDTPISTGLNSGLSSNWSRQHNVMGTKHEWYDASGNKRAKSSQPLSDTDGVIISANVTP
ncbi:hypothetical protein [Klebsiella pneumoniae]|uniref:hypothetical protein n=1 Tax=Klebsiella pneumoniae TaxID=573 RepID=UPI00197AB5DC|nr:hypothetical protein [Klebsiella pneumoniae]